LGNFLKNFIKPRISGDSIAGNSFKRREERERRIFLVISFFQDLILP